jgi:oligopeptide transport system permease protein
MAIGMSRCGGADLCRRTADANILRHCRCSRCPVAGWDGSLRKIMPIIALALPNIAYIASLARGSMIESLAHQSCADGPRQGIGGWRTVTRHALIGGLARGRLPRTCHAGIVTGSIVIEKISASPVSAATSSMPR